MKPIRTRPARMADTLHRRPPKGVVSHRATLPSRPPFGNSRPRCLARLARKESCTRARAAADVEAQWTMSTLSCHSRCKYLNRTSNPQLLHSAIPASSSRIEASSSKRLLRTHSQLQQNGRSSADIPTLNRRLGQRATYWRREDGHGDSQPTVHRQPCQH